MKQKGKRIGALLLAAVLLVTMQTVSIPAKTHTLGNTVTNQMLGSATSEYDGRIYYGYDDKIYSVKKDGTGKQTVYTMKDGQGLNGFSSVMVLDGYVYAIFDFYGGSDASNSQLVRIKLDGTGYKNYGNAANVTAVDGKLYYTKGVMRTEEDSTYMEYKGVYSMNKDGSKSKALVKKNGFSLNATDGRVIYYSGYNTKTAKYEVYRCDMKGKNRKNLLSSENLRNGCFAVDGNDFYYALENTEGTYSTSIYKTNIKTGSQKKIYTCKGDIQSVCVNGKYLLMSSYEKGLVRVNKSTGKSKVLNKHTGAGICGIHGSVMIYEQYRMDMKNGTDIDMILAKTSTGKKIKKIGAFFVS